MKVIVLVAVCIILVAVAHARPDGKYTTKYDNVDIDEILHNERLLKSYVNCLLSKGTCSPDGAELKKVLPDALSNDCSKCSDKQKEGSKKVIHFLIKKKPDMWADLEAVYDKDGEYKKKHAADLNSK